MIVSSSWEKWQLKFHWGEIEGVNCEQRPALSRRKKKEKKKQYYSEDITLACLDKSQRVCLHLNQLPPTVSNCYIHVNMAKAGAVTVVLVIV